MTSEDTGEGAVIENRSLLCGRIF